MPSGFCQKKARSTDEECFLFVHGNAGLGWARQGGARRGKAKIGWAWQGDARYDKAEMIYIIKAADTNFFKVGVSDDPQRRLAQLQTGCPYSLTLHRVFEGDEREEAQLHNLLRAHAMNGGTEWFDVEPSTIDQIITEKEKHLNEKRITRYYGEVGKSNGIYTDHVRQVCRGQQNATPRIGENVLHPRHYPVVPSSSEHIFVPERQEFDIGRQDVRRTILQELGKRLAWFRPD